MWENIKKIASSYAEEYCSDAIYPSHLFKAILHKDSGLVRFLEVDMDKDYYFMQQWADVQMQMSPRASRPIRDPELSEQSQVVFDEAQDYTVKFGLEEPDNVCLLASLVTPGVGFTFDELKTLPLSASEVAARYGSSSEANIEVAHSQTKSGVGSGAGAIQKYCINKNEMVENGTIGTVIGFESEMLSICEILGRKTKSNLLISGEGGVGKSALVDGFARKLVDGSVPWFLSGYVLYELDLALLSSDASYKGEVEDRFKKVVTEIQQSENAILLIESIDKIFDKQSTLFGCSTILKQEIGRGNILLLATCSIDGYTKSIETDKEFVGKIEKMTLDEPNADMTLRILMGSIDCYSEYHKLSIEESVLVEAIRVAKRYLTEKALPDSAFDLLDRTMALVKTMNDLAGSDVASLSESLDQIEAEGADVSGEAEASIMKRLDWLYYEMVGKVSCILLSQIDLDVDFSKIATIKERVEYLRGVLSELATLGEQKRESLQSSDLFAVVARQTGIPMGKVQSKERDKLVGAEDTLKKRVIGQDHAVKIVLDAVFESRSGLSKKGQPMGSFFFLGPTGTGKTELSKALAAFLFEDESSLIRFDMSEFKEEHSVALLYGAPPGYVGYEEGGLLVNKIRQKPYSVVLFDEIEKAHKSVFDLFLQILDEGKLHDRLGRVGDFSNALILFTSNIGSKFVVREFEKGNIPKNNDLMDIMQEHFRPEFLGRLTEIVPFSPIVESTVSKIFDIHLKDLYKLLAEQDIKLLLSEEVKMKIAMRGFNPQYGARPIIGIIRKELRRPLSKLIIAGTIKSGDCVEVYFEDDNVGFRTV